MVNKRVVRIGKFCADLENLNTFVMSHEVVGYAHHQIIITTFSGTMTVLTEFSQSIGLFVRVLR